MTSAELQDCKSIKEHICHFKKKKKAVAALYASLLK